MWHETYGHEIRLTFKYVNVRIPNTVTPSLKVPSLGSSIEKSLASFASVNVFPFLMGSNKATVPVEPIILESADIDGSVQTQSIAISTFASASRLLFISATRLGLL